MSRQSSPTRRTVLGAAAGLLAGAALAGCTAGTSGGNPTTSAEVDATVEVGPDNRYAFRPGTDEPLRVAAGDTVAFVWKSDTHNVVVESQPDGADWPGVESVRDAGHVHEYTFEVAGRYEYVCRPHEQLGMVGTLVVE